MSILIRLTITLMALLPLQSLAIDEPDYVVLEKTGDLEIRQYPALIVARTRVQAGFKDAGNVAFRRLAGYIFGGNASDQKIAMTAPVAMTPAPDSDETYWVSFFMPEEYRLADLPQPADELVEITRTPATQMAVVSYRGGWSEQKYKTNRESLFSLLAGTNWKIAGEPVWARYNSPLRPPFLRTNEVMVPVEPDSRLSEVDGQAGRASPPEENNQ